MVERQFSTSIVNTSVVESKINFPEKKENSEILNKDLFEMDNYQNVSNEQLQDVIKKMNDFVSPTSHIQFVLHEELNEYYVKVINDKTEEVIKEFPSKKLMDIYATMNNILGILFDKKI